MSSKREMETYRNSLFLDDVPNAKTIPDDGPKAEAPQCWVAAVRGGDNSVVEGSPARVDKNARASHVFTTPDLVFVVPLPETFERVKVAILAETFRALFGQGRVTIEGEPKEANFIRGR